MTLDSTGSGGSFLEDRQGQAAFPAAARGGRGWGEGWALKVGVGGVGRVEGF